MKKNSTALILAAIKNRNWITVPNTYENRGSLINLTKRGFTQHFFDAGRYSIYYKLAAPDQPRDPSEDNERGD